MLFVTNRRVEGSRRSAGGPPDQLRSPATTSLGPRCSSASAWARAVCRADRDAVLRPRCAARRGGRSCFSSTASTASPRAASFRMRCACSACATPWRRTWSRWSRWSGRATTISASCSITGTTSRRPRPAASPWRGRLASSWPGATGWAPRRPVSSMSTSWPTRWATASWRRRWAHGRHGYGAVPAMFRNVFMAAADVANDVFAPGQPGAP